MNKLKVSIVIPNWNGKELLKNCLISLNKQTFKDFEVIIIDNGSTDDSVKYIKTYFPTVRIKSLDRNYGFAKAVNEGIKISKGEFVWLLNNDTELDKNCLKYLVEDILKFDTFFVTPKFLDYKRRDVLELAGDTFTIDVVGHLYSSVVGKKDVLKFNKAEYCFLASGGGTLYKKEIFKKVGLFDDDYFFYYEDADLSLRAQLMGYKGWFEPRAKIYHLRMATAKKNFKLVEYLVFRNMMMTILKDYPTELLLNNFNWLKIILVILNTFRYFILKGEIFSALKAIGYIMFNLDKILEKRAKIQKSKIVSDEYIIKNISKKTITVGKLLSW